jgi:hypothetical protein
MSITLKLADLLHAVNERNELSSCAPEIRQGWNSILESFLMAAGCYIGFGYLLDGEVPKGDLPGMTYVDGEFLPITEKQFHDEMSLANAEGRKPACGRNYPDLSRRTYFVARELQADYQAAEERASRPGEIKRPADSVETSEEYL